MKHKVMKPYLFITLLFAAVACSSDNEEDLTPNGENNSDDPCNTEAITYENGISTFLTENCNMSGCHNAGGGRSLATYNEVMTYVNNGTFRNRVIVQQNMPPAGNLTDCELQQVEAWLDDGAPEN